MSKETRLWWQEGREAEEEGRNWSGRIFCFDCLDVYYSVNPLFTRIAWDIASHGMYEITTAHQPSSHLLFNNELAPLTPSSLCSLNICGFVGFYLWERLQTMARTKVKRSIFSGHLCLLWFFYSSCMKHGLWFERLDLTESLTQNFKLATSDI
jgi:hypothetical protein